MTEFSPSDSTARTRRNYHLIPLTPRDPEYSLVERPFCKGWKHANKQKPTVRAIFRVWSSQESEKSYQNYLDTVQRSLPGRKLEKIQKFLFHGTNRACLLGEDGHNTLCASSDCSVCSIIRNSFDIRKTGTRYIFQRFGSGIYTTSCSSKADDYSSNLHEGATFRVLLMGRVVVGNAFKTRKNHTTCTGLSHPYHSLIGEPGVHLNYEETVVFSNDAIRPAYLVVYG